VGFTTPCLCCCSYQRCWAGLGLADDCLAVGLLCYLFKPMKVSLQNFKYSNMHPLILLHPLLYTHTMVYPISAQTPLHCFLARKAYQIQPCTCVIYLRSPQPCCSSSLTSLFTDLSSHNVFRSPFMHFPPRYSLLFPKHGFL